MKNLVPAVLAVAVGALLAQPALTESRLPESERSGAPMLHLHDSPAAWQRGQGRERATRTVHRSGPGLLSLACSPNAAQRLDRLFQRVQARLELTGEQEPLFDDLRAAALIAQTGFADACTAARTTLRADGGRTLPARLKVRLDLEQARVAALTEVFPVFETLYDSLTDDQKRVLEPRRGTRSWRRSAPGNR